MFNNCLIYCCYNPRIYALFPKIKGICTLTENTHMDGGCKYTPFCPQSELLPTPLLLHVTDGHRASHTLGPNGVRKQDYAELIHCHTHRGTAAQSG